MKALNLYHNPDLESFSPRITFIAIFTIGIPVTLLRIGTVREALGLTSMT